jgi:hypothetical protein
LLPLPADTFRSTSFTDGAAAIANELRAMKLRPDLSELALEFIAVSIRTDTSV